MSEIISLNKARKAQTKRQKEAQAAANRVKFGQTKAQRDDAEKTAERIARTLDDKKIED